MGYFKKKQIPPVWILGIASGLSPFGMTIVIPAINSITERFNATFNEVQYVISAYLFGLAIAQPINGFLCDRYGRRPIMLIGFSLFVIASLYAAIANSLDQLIFARFLQAVGVSVGTVTSRAILRDSYDRNKMAEVMSYIAVAMGVAPIAAPIFGGMIDSTVGYSSIFVATSLIGMLVLAKVYFGLSETLPEDMEPPKISAWLQNYRLLLVSRSFIGNTLVFGFVQGSFFSFVAVGSLLFATDFGVSSSEFGVLWSTMAVSYVVGAVLSAKLTPRIGTSSVMDASIALTLVSGVAVLLCTFIGELSIAKILVPLGLMMVMSGGASPGSLSGAVADHPTRAGSAAGLSSAIGMTVAGVFSIIAGSVYDGDYQVIAWLILLSNIGCVISWLVARAASKGETETENETESETKNGTESQTVQAELRLNKEIL